uniref:Olfactory receptor n=1 Tax=Phocoena sinus TaxID=42100 RepID=A0A8C9BRM1_PHOSS
MGDNMTCITEFTLLGFPLDATIQMLLFGLFSLFYVFTLLGNGVILGLISLDSRLPDKPISFAGCMTQSFLFLTFAVTECLLLVVMSYDHHVAICQPL